MPPKKPKPKAEKPKTYERHRKRLNVTLSDACREQIAAELAERPYLRTASAVLELAVSLMRKGVSK
jgi:hypothetical protein